MWSSQRGPILTEATWLVWRRHSALLQWTRWIITALPAAKPQSLHAAYLSFPLPLPFCLSSFSPSRYLFCTHIHVNTFIYRHRSSSSSQSICMCFSWLGTGLNLETCLNEPTLGQDGSPAPQLLLVLPTSTSLQTVLVYVFLCNFFGLWSNKPAITSEQGFVLYI